jgi:ribonuclease HI
MPLNFNATSRFFGTDPSGAARVVLRNCCGEAVAGRACPLENVLNAAAAEALALLRGLELLEQLGCASVVIESDSMELIHACNGEMEIWSPHSARVFFKSEYDQQCLFSTLS